MARQDSGSRVARAGATGGGRTYRARVPYRWYSGLALIVIVGISLVVYSRYENLHPATPPAAVAPTTSDHWAAGLDFDLCGHGLQTLANSPNSINADLGLFSSGGGVIQIEPKSAADSGVNATVGRFAARYPGLTLTADSVGLPKGHVYKNGSTCPAGTPDAGKTGVLSAYIYPTATASAATQQTGDVRTVRFTQETQIVTIAFLPAGSSVVAPDQTIINAVLDAESAASTTSTTSTLPLVTTTTKPKTTGTTGNTTSTTAGRTTTTTSSSASTTTSTTK
jgi:hypothetical protein